MIKMRSKSIAGRYQRIQHNRRTTHRTHHRVHMLPLSLSSLPSSRALFARFFSPVPVRIEKKIQKLFIVVVYGTNYVSSSALYFLSKRQLKVLFLARKIPRYRHEYQHDARKGRLRARCERRRRNICLF